MICQETRCAVPGIRTSGCYADSTVDIFAITDLVNHDLARRVINEVDDAVVSLTNTISVVEAGKFFASMWTGIRRQSIDLRHYPGAIGLGCNGGKLLAR